MQIVRQCPVCGVVQTLQVKEKDFLRWKSGARIQEAFPELSADEREILLSGVCPDCWERMYGDD